MWSVLYKRLGLPEGETRETQTHHVLLQNVSFNLHPCTFCYKIQVASRSMESIQAVRIVRNALVEAPPRLPWLWDRV